MDLVSIIVPVYNVEPYLRRCVDSILAQTYSNLEVILVDDGSPDNCGAICDEYAEKDLRIKAIHQTNRGVSAARNAGLDIAEGDYVSFVDADDFVDADMIDSLLCVANSQCADIVECNYRRTPDAQGGSGDVFACGGIEAAVKMFTEDGYPAGFVVSPFAKLIRRKLTQNIRFLEGCSMAEDMLYVVELFCKSSKVVKLDKRLYTYWLNPDSVTSRAYSNKKADEVCAVYRAMLIMDQTGNAQLSTIGKRRYVDVLLSHWVNCVRLGEMGRATAAALRKRLFENYALVKQSLSKKQRMKCLIFKMMPRCYYWINCI